MKKITVKLSDMREEVFVGTSLGITEDKYYLSIELNKVVVGMVKNEMVDCVRIEEIEDEVSNIKEEVELAIYENNKEWRKCFWKFESFLKWVGSDWIIGDYKKHFKHMMK